MFQFPVPASGNCSDLGVRYPPGAGSLVFAPGLTVQSAANKLPPFSTSYGVSNEDMYAASAAQNPHSLFNQQSIIGRSVKVCATAACVPTENPPPQCATIKMAGVRSTVLRAEFNVSSSQIRGVVSLQQVTSPTDESDTTIFVELESTNDTHWNNYWNGSAPTLHLQITNSSGAGALRMVTR